MFLNIPREVVFFVGPPGAPPDIVQAYANACRLAEEGDRAALDDFIRGRMSLLEQIANENGSKAPLQELIEAVLTEPVGPLEAVVSGGFLNGHLDILDLAAG